MFIKHPHSRHCFVKCRNRSQPLQTESLELDSSSFALGACGFIRSSGVTPPFFSLNFSQRDLSLICSYYNISHSINTTLNAADSLHYVETFFIMLPASRNLKAFITRYSNCSRLTQQNRS